MNTFEGIKKKPKVSQIMKKTDILAHFSGNFAPFYEKYLGSDEKVNDRERKAVCPFHEDTDPSLNFNLATGLFKCFGCDAGGDIFSFYAKKHGLSLRNGQFGEVLSGIAKDFGISNVSGSTSKRKPKKKKWRDPSRVYDYLSADGKKVVHQTVRFDNPKEFRQRRPNPKGGKPIWDLKGIEPVLFNLPEVVKEENQTIYVCEGEKDALVANGLGLTGTTCPMGAEKWRPHYNKHLEDKDVIIIPDKDGPGKLHGESVARSLHGTARSIKIVNLPGLAEHGDLYDYVCKFPVEKRHEAADELRRLAEEAPLYEPTEDTGEAPKPTCDLKSLCNKILSGNEAAGDFDLCKLPSILMNYVNSLSAKTAADPIMLLQAVLCTVSAALKRNVYIGRDTYFQRLYVNLFILCVAASGSFKTTALRKGARFAFELNKMVDEEIEILKMDLLKAKDDSQKEVIQIRIKNAEKRRPLMPSKMTPEAMLLVLADGCGGMIPISELGEWLANLQKSHNADFRGLITDFYDCPPYYRYKTKNSGDFVVEYPFLTINALSTLRWLADYLDGNDVESGFFARFLIFCPPRKTIIPPALPRRDINERHALAYDAFKNAIETVMNLSGQDGGREYFLSQEAAELFTYIHTSFFFFLENNGQHQDDLLEPFVKRWGPYVLKLALLMQIFIEPNTDEIGVDAMRAAEAIVEYSVKSTLHLFRKHFELPAVAKEEQKVLEYIAKKGGTVKRHTLQGSRLIDGGSFEYDKILESLKDQGRIIIHKYSDNGTNKRLDTYELCELPLNM